jgi:tetratricopeptide (TPR) repeat protein
MSPEQATGDALLDGRSDIYSLACVLYEMLAGEPPFTGRTAQAIVARRLSESVPPLRTVRDVPAPVERVVLRALARSPADRFRDASQFGRALQAATGSEIEAARGSPLTRRHWPGRRLFLITAGILLAVALGAGIYRRVRLQPEVALDPNLLAVAPFDVLDPSLQLWREGLGDILSRSLDGAGPLRTVSQTVALRHWQGRGDRASAETLGRRTGAGLVVYGVVLPKGRDSVSLRAEVLDGARGGAGPMEVAVSGEVSRIGELADSLGIEILQTLSPSRPIGAVRQVSMGSRSLPALKAFLQGEQFLRRGLWDSALARYDQSIAADSTFALALQRMDGVLGWNPATAGAYRPFGEYSRRAIQYNHGLSPRDSLLLAADSFRIAAETATEAGAYVRFFYRSVAALEEAVRRYPGAPEAWYALGEARYHAPRPLVAPPATVFKTFARTIALDSGFAPAYEHMPGLALRLGRPDLARHYANAYVSLDPTARNSSDTRLVALLLDRARDADSEAARLIDTASVHTLFEAVLDGSLALWPDSGETAVRLIRRMGEPQRADGGNAAWVLDSLMWPQYLAATLAFRGHLREAYEADERLLLDASASRWSAFLDPFLDLSLLGVIPDSIARSTFGRSFEAGASWGDDFTPRHLQGLPWWLAHRDSTSLERLAARAAKKSQEPNPPVITLRARLLGATASAFLALVRGDSVTALQKLQAIPDTLCMAANCFYLNFTLAKLLTARGEYRRAEVVLERWRWDAAGTPTFVLAMLERGRIAERLEEREKAIESYGFVADAWHRADPELEPYVIEAREGLRRLTRNR